MDVGVNERFDKRKLRCQCLIEVKKTCINQELSFESEKICMQAFK